MNHRVYYKRSVAEIFILILSILLMKISKDLSLKDISKKTIVNRLNKIVVIKVPI